MLVLAHVRELLEQAADKLRAVAPDLPVGLYSAGLKRRDLGYPVTIAGIQSVYQRGCDVGAVDLVIVDEAHLIAPDCEGMYRTFLADMQQINPQVRVIGLTATPFRMKSGSICSPDNILNEICYEVGVPGVRCGAQGWGTVLPGVWEPGLRLADVLGADRSTYNQGMRYVGTVYRPPSEANSYLLQATIGCSWNHCTYCATYEGKQFRVRPLDETLEDIAIAGREFGARVRKVFVMDGDALVMELGLWEPILEALRATFPNLRRVSCYATAMNLLAKTPEELRRLRELGLELLYIGPESGDDVTLKRIAKGANSADHVEAAAKARRAGMKQSLIFLLGAGGVERSMEHATASARLATAMDPTFLSALTLMLIPSTPIHKLAQTGRFQMPSVEDLLRELRILVDEANPSDAIFRCNHASNYLPIGGRLPRDREAILQQIDAALSGEVPFREEWSRGL